MRGGISKDTIAKTQKCWADFVCLSNHAAPVCPASGALADKHVVLKTPRRLDCPYLITRGSASHVCSCPVRNALFRRHQV